MTTRKTYTPAQMRNLADGKGSQFLMDDMRGALRYAADLIEAADAIVEENRLAIGAGNATKECARCNTWFNGKCLFCGRSHGSPRLGAKA